MTQRDVVFPPGRQALYEHNRYSPAIRANGLLFVSGQVGSREDGSPEPELEAQVRRAFDNLNAILEAAGCTFEDVIDVTVFMVDPQAIFERVWNRWCPSTGAGTASDGYRRGRDLALWLSPEIKVIAGCQMRPERPRRSTQQGDGLDLCPQLLTGVTAS